MSNQFSHVNGKPVFSQNSYSPHLNITTIQIKQTKAKCFLDVPDTYRVLVLPCQEQDQGRS